MDAKGTAFASDFDGTLCQSNWDTGEEIFDPAVLDAVCRYQEAGGLFGICSGRPLFAIQASLEGILVPDFYIATTGAQIVDGEGRTLFQKAIDREVAQALYDRYASNEMHVLAVTDTDFLSIGRAMSPQMRVVSSLDEVEGELLGISLECHSNEPLARAACDEMNELFGGQIAGFQNLGSVDVVAQGCSKGVGVRLAKEMLSVTCIAGAGDSYNDLPLLEATDVSYTFHSSPQEVRDAATQVVADLAEALDCFMGNH